jgi:hypothetical protein
MTESDFQTVMAQIAALQRRVDDLERRPVSYGPVPIGPSPVPPGWPVSPAPGWPLSPPIVTLCETPGHPPGKVIRGELHLPCGKGWSAETEHAAPGPRWTGTV